MCPFNQWLLPSEGGYLEAEGIEKTWRIKQDTIGREVDISSAKNQYDIVLPGSCLLCDFFLMVCLHNKKLFWPKMFMKATLLQLSGIP